MCYKIITLALAVSVVNSRPQYQLLQPLYFQGQQTLVPLTFERLVSSEQAFLPNLGNVQPQPNADSHFINTNSQPLQPFNRRHAENVPERQHIPSQDFNVHNRELHQSLEKSNQRYEQANKNPVQNSDQYSQLFQPEPQDNTRQQSDLKTNFNKSLQRNISSLNPTNKHHIIPTNNYPEHTTTSINTNRNKNSQQSSNATIYNQEQPKTNEIDEQTSSHQQKPIPNQQDLNTQNNKTNKQMDDNNTHLFNPNKDIDQNGRTVMVNKNGYNERPSNSSFMEPVLDYVTPSSVKEGRNGDDTMRGDDDRWTWGLADVTEKDVDLTGTTPDLDDRASFDGDACPMGKVKVGTMCIDKH